jgi:hypothetical protein
VVPRKHARNWHRLSRDADVAATNPAVPNQFRGDEPDRIARDREAQPLGGYDRRRVDADDIAARGHERPAGVAGIEGRVGLDHVVDQAPRLGPQGTA